MMESVKNNCKGYDIVGNPSQANNRRRRIIIAASSALFLTLIIAAVIGAVIHESVTESSESEEEHPSLSSNSDSVASLKTVCAVTQHPDSCFNSISSLNKPPKNDPAQIFNLSLLYNLLDLKNISSFPQTLIPRSNDPGTESALHDCVSLFADSVSQVNQTVELMSVGPGEKVFTEMKISDMNTWISAAMTNLETCLDGLKEMKSTVVDQVSARVQQSEEGLSNTLAILSNLQKLQGKFGLTMP